MSCSLLLQSLLAFFAPVDVQGNFPRYLRFRALPSGATEGQDDVPGVFLACEVPLDPVFPLGCRHMVNSRALESVPYISWNHEAEHVHESLVQQDGAAQST